MSSQLYALQQFFIEDDVPKLLVSAEGDIILINAAANLIYQSIGAAKIQDILPSIESVGQSFNQQLLDVYENACRLSVRFCHEHGQYLLSLEFEGLSDWAKFSQMNQTLHEIYIDLCQCENEMQLYQHIVIAARKHLKIDRIGILLFAEDQKKVVGTWGTNSLGELNDERELVLDNPADSSLPENYWISYALKNKNAVSVNYDHQLVDFGKYVGNGWNAISAFWDGDTPTGWIACDNLINRQPLPDWHREIIGELSRLTGQLVSKMRRQQDLKTMNTQLKEQVLVRTKELNVTIEELKSAQNELVEAEKLASLGALVAGVSHEINTPLGIGLTAASFMQDMLKELSQHFEDNTIKKNYLLEFIDAGSESSHLIVESLGRAAELVKSFKKLAVDQTMQIQQEVNLFDAAHNVIISFKHNYKNRHITIENRIRKTLVIHGVPGEYMQVFTNLFNNSLMHAFGVDGGKILFDAYVKHNKLYVIYQDNGQGVPKQDLKKISQPFFTTKRNQGGTGLGLSIVHNIIKKMHGKTQIELLKPTGLKFCFIINLPDASIPAA